jgi:hypothetical protein
MINTEISEIIYFINHFTIECKKEEKEEAFIQFGFLVTAVCFEAR